MIKIIIRYYIYIAAWSGWIICGYNIRKDRVLVISFEQMDIGQFIKNLFKIVIDI